MIARVLAAIAIVAAVAGCTSSGSPSPGRSTGTSQGTSSQSSTPTRTPHVREVRAASCPFVSKTFVLDTMGMRLSRLTVLHSAGRTIGCRFYALQDSPLHNSEHLPGPHQPVVEIVAWRYPTAADAHNTFVLLSRRGTNAQRTSLGRVTGVCFQNDFYARDHGKDWACAANVGRIEVVVRTVDTTGTFSTATLTRRVLRGV